MTNEQKYKTIEERQKAFERFCTKSGGNCGKCNIANPLGGTSCILRWLADEYQGPKMPFTVVENNIIDAHNKNRITSYFSNEYTQKICDALNAAAIAWHKRMMEKEGK